MSSGRVFRFTPTPEHQAHHLFVFLHGCGATAQSMIPIAFRFQARFPSAALVVPSGFNPDARGGAAQDWYPTRGLNCDNHRQRVAAVLPDVEDLVRREQTRFSVPESRTVLIGFSQGGTVALEAVKAPGLAGAVVAYSSRYARLPEPGARIGARIHLVHGEVDSVVSRVYAERAARVLNGLHVPVTLDIVEDLGHALSHRAISLGSLRLLQGIYEGRRATLH
ncbi:MAG TPA: dienelactone hydrolase family protein [Burkholderiales bacterium]